jgi:hypothetical protein
VNHELDKFNSIADHEPFMITNVGSSHGDYDFSYTDPESKGWKCFNFGMPSQTYAYDLALLKQFSGNFADGGIMFIPVSYFSFNDETVDDTEKQASQVRYYQILSPENNPDYDWFIDLTTHRLPILTGGGQNLLTLPDLWKQDHDGVRRNDIIGLPELFRPLPVQAAGEEAATADSTAAADSTVETADSAAADSTAMAADSAAMPTTGEALQAYMEAIVGQSTVERYKALGLERYHRHFDDKTEYFRQDRIDELKEIIQFAQSKNITPVLVTTPFMVYYTENIDTAWYDQFYITVDGICKDTGVQYYDYGRDDRFQYTFGYFADCDHLNEAGRAYFQSVLQTDIPAYQQLLAAGPDSLK